jgi:hypothetical protein
MQTVFASVLIAVLFPLSLWADVEITKEEAASVPSYSLDQFEKVGPTLHGLVKLKFAFREEAVTIREGNV